MIKGSGGWASSPLRWRQAAEHGYGWLWDFLHVMLAERRFLKILSKWLKVLLSSESSELFIILLLHILGWRDPQSLLVFMLIAWCMEPTVWGSSGTASCKCVHAIFCMILVWWYSVFCKGGTTSWNIQSSLKPSPMSGSMFLVTLGSSVEGFRVCFHHFCGFSYLDDLEVVKQIEENLGSGKSLNLSWISDIWMIMML